MIIEYYLKVFFSTGKINLLSIEPAFWIIAFISKCFFFSSVRFVIMIYAVIGVSLHILAIKRVSHNPALSIFIYICLYFVLHEMTQIRQGVACALFLWSIPDIMERRSVQYYFKILLALLFHYSAIIAFPVYFMKRNSFNKVIYLLLPIIGIIVAQLDTVMLNFFSLFGDIPKVAAYVNRLKSGETGYYNIFNLYNSGLLILYYIISLNVKKLRFECDILLLKIYGLMMFIYYALSIVPTFSVRLSQFFGIVLVVLLAHAVKIIKEIEFSRLAVVIFALVVLSDQLFKQHFLRF